MQKIERARAYSGSYIVMKQQLTSWNESEVAKAVSATVSLFLLLHGFSSRAAWHLIFVRRVVRPSAPHPWEARLTTPPLSKLPIFTINLVRLVVTCLQGEIACARYSVIQALQKNRLKQQVTPLGGNSTTRVSKRAQSP
jgi:hypothetical protein